MSMRYCRKIMGFSASMAALTAPLSLNAQEDLLASITSGMQRYSEVATKTKVNESYQPYIISVFTGKELEKLGIVSLEEALILVPGVDMSTDNMNNKSPIFRGSNPTAFGQSKLFIDGVPANNVFFDGYSEHLRMPVEMIKRIEVVRGPGSKTDGFNAYAGSINVITYAENIEGFENGDKVVFKAGSFDYYMAGFVKSYKAGDFTLATDFSYQRDDKKLYAGPDGLSQGVLSFYLPQDAFGPGVPASDINYDNTGLSESGDAYLWSKSYALGMTLSYKDLFYAKLRLLDHTQASAYGINVTLAAKSDDRLKQPNHYLELGMHKEINDFDISINGGVKYDTFDSKANLVQPGLKYFDFFRYKTDPAFVIPDDLLAETTFDNGVLGIHSAKQRMLYQSTFLRYSGFEKHNISVGYRLSKEETISMVSKLSDWGTGEYTPTDYTETFPFFDKDAKRYTRSISFQDTYHHSEHLSFLFGFNYERTSFEDAGFEPRVSMVYQRDAYNIYKAIYSESHRNASWQEMYTMNNHARQGSTEFVPERVKAYELAYVHKFNNDNHLQANLFYLKNDDQISLTGDQGVFSNIGDTDTYGLELEYKGNLTPRDRLYLNYSYVKGKDNNDEPLANVADHMAKGSYSYDLTSALSASTVLRHVSKKRRLEDDTRESLKGYTKVDATLRYDDPKYEYHVMLSVKNISDTDIRFPSKSKTYIEDYTQEGRTFMLTFGKEF